MSKSKWGAGLSFFVAVAIQFVSIPEVWKKSITIVAIIGIVVCLIGWWMTKDKKDKLNISAQGVGGNVVAAGRDATQSIHHHYASVAEPQRRSPEITVIINDAVKLLREDYRLRNFSTPSASDGRSW